MNKEIITYRDDDDDDRMMMCVHNQNAIIRATNDENIVYETMLK